MIQDQSYAAELTRTAAANSVCAIIVTYHIGRGLFRCLNSVINQVGEVLIVDNGSDQETLQALRQAEACPRVRVIYNGCNLGIARALNQGVQYAIGQGYRWALTLDHDSEATPGMVSALLQAFDDLGERVGIAAPNPFDRNTRTFWPRNVVENSQYVIRDEPVISSGSLMSVSIFERVGFFNESLFIYYVDDDFCFRVLRSGLQIVRCCEPVLLHSEGTKELRRLLWRKVFYEWYSAEAKYYIARNALYMLKHHHEDLGYCYVQVRRLVADSVKVLVYDPQRLRKAKFIARGLWDGLRGSYGPLRSSH